MNEVKNYKSYTDGHNKIYANILNKRLKKTKKILHERQFDFRTGEEKKIIDMIYTHFFHYFILVFKRICHFSILHL